jgi:cobyric acid synthase
MLICCCCRRHRHRRFVVVAAAVVVVVPKHFIVATFKKSNMTLNAVILFCVLSTRYEDTLSSVTLCF